MLLLNKDVRNLSRSLRANRSGLFKLLTIAAWLLVFSSQSQAVEEEAVYGARLIVGGKPTSTCELALADLQKYLQKITGQRFSRVPEPMPDSDKNDGEPPAILLLTADSPLVSTAIRERLAGAASQEAVVLWSSGDRKRLWIVANKFMGLQQGVYLYLEMLGCKWYMAGDKWEVIPRRDDIRVKVDRLWQPIFKMRVFSGTGGFGPPFPVDPRQTGKADWEDWARRNHFGGEYRIAGHVGEMFNVKFKNELEAHPEYRAMVNGARVPWSEGMKISYGNPEVVKLWTDWTVERMRHLIKVAPNEADSAAVSVDPADGYDHCESPESLKIGSVSDRVAFVANASARAVAKEFPGKLVSYQAYNLHLLPPSIPLEPNVHAMVIPYAFNSSGYTADQILDMWSKKSNQISVYTYYSIPDWSRDLPTHFSYLDRPKEDLLNWSRRKVGGFCVETTYSNGAMGPGWYVVSRLMNNPDGEVGPVMDEFFSDLFGGAKTPMRRMIERWAQGFRATEVELGNSYKDLREARKLAEGDAIVQARIDDFRRYIHYIRLEMEYEDAVIAGNQTRYTAATELVRYCWRIYPSRMIHSYRMSDLVCKWERNADLLAEWDPANPAASGWTNYYKPVEIPELDRLITEGEAKYPYIQLERREFSSKLVPVSSTVKVTGEFSNQVYVKGDVDLAFWARSGVGRLPLKLRLRRVAPTPAKPVPPAPVVQLVDPTDKIVEEIRVKGDYEWEDVAIKVPRPGSYRVRIVGAENAGIRAPRGISLSLTRYRGQVLEDWKSRLYFYVPAGMRRFAIFTHTAQPITIYDPTGSPVKLPRANRMVIVEVPKGADGKAWSFTNETSTRDIEMINLPSSFAFHPDGLLIPDNADKPSLRGKAEP